MSIEQQTSPTNETSEDEMLDLTLRPKSWRSFVGQDDIKENLRIIIEASKKRGESSCEHLLFYGNSGLGKTTLAHIVANEMGNKIRVVSGTSITKIGDLAAILTNLDDGDILFVDEIHRLNRLIEEFLYPAMEEYKLHLILGTGPMAKTMELDLPRFTLIGATTKIGLLSTPLRNRFGAIFQLDFYGDDEIADIIERSAKILEIDVDRESAKKIARRSRLTPRVANRLLKRVRDWAQVKGQGVINPPIVQDALSSLHIDEKGLETGDRRVLKTIIEKFEGGPVGVQAISAASSEEMEAIIDIYEPYLMKIGLIKRTPQGRVATKLAYKHLNIEPSSRQKDLF